MNVIIDGAVFRWQHHGGISRMFREIVPRMCDQEPALRVGMLSDGPPCNGVPRHRRITQYPPVPAYALLGHGRAARVLGPRLAAMSERLALRHRRNAIWHPTYYTRPRQAVAREVVTVVDMIHERFAHALAGQAHDDFRARKRECLVNADAIICISNATRQDVLTFCPGARGATHVVPLAHSAAFRVLAGEPEAAPERPFVLYVGDRAGAHKNVPRLLDAFSRWPQRRDVDLVLAGAPLGDEERRDLAARGLDGRVRVVVHPDDATLARLYNQAAMLVYPSLHEGFGIPLLEAMACGCPIVASRIPSTVEVAGDCAIYFDPVDPMSLAAALDAGLTEHRNGTRIRAGLDRVTQASWDIAAARTLAVYQSVC